MAYNKFITQNTTLLDLTGDDLTNDTTKVANGYKYHGRDGVQYTGTGSGGGQQPTLFAPTVTGGINTIAWENNTQNGGFQVTIAADVNGTPVTSPLTITEQMDGQTLTITASATNFENATSTILLNYIATGSSLLSVGAETAIGSKTETVQLWFNNEIDSNFSRVFEETTQNFYCFISANGTATNRTITHSCSLVGKRSIGGSGISLCRLAAGLYTGETFGYTKTRDANVSEGTWENQITVNCVVYDSTANTQLGSITKTFNQYRPYNYEDTLSFPSMITLTEGHVYTLLINATITPKS